MKFIKIILLAVVLFGAGNSSVNACSKSKKQKSKQVLATMERVADWQLASWEKNGTTWPKWDWTNGAGYVGIEKLGRISKNPVYLETLLQFSKDLDWNTGPNRFYADDYIVGYTFTKMYLKHKDPQMIAKFRALADSIVAQPHTESLEWKNDINHREWAWCDALFMGPPALSILAKATGEMKYMDITDKLWWKTYDYLYDKEEHLFFRDGSHFKRREKNGEKVFWSRGNGWVMAGLALTLDNMPKKVSNP